MRPESELIEAETNLETWSCQVVGALLRLYEGLRDSSLVAGWGTQNNTLALAGVAQWIECRPANQRVAGSIPSQDTRLGCGPGPQQGAGKRQPHLDVSLPLFFPPFPSL